MAKTILSLTDKLSDAEALSMAEVSPKPSHILEESKLVCLSGREISSGVLYCLMVVRSMLDESSYLPTHLLEA